VSVYGRASRVIGEKYTFTEKGNEVPDWEDHIEREWASGLLEREISGKKGKNL